jgi:hypothetical protein
VRLVEEKRLMKVLNMKQKKKNRTEKQAALSKEARVSLLFLIFVVHCNWPFTPAPKAFRNPQRGESTWAR